MASRRTSWRSGSGTKAAQASQHYQRVLEQKAPGWVEKVNPAYTSQTCNACRHVAPESRKSQADFACVACGHQDNADVNAARNIADRSTTAGLAVAARGDRVRLARSVKREPQLVAS